MVMLDSAQLMEIVKFKQNFLANKQVDPLSCSLLDHEVATSWKRSRDYGIDPNMTNITKRITRENFLRLQEKYEPLIDIANSVFKIISLSIYQRKLVFSLITPSGIFLLRQGNCPGNFIIEQNKEVLLSTEQTAGTSAHALTFRFKHPFQLLGVEHYRNKFEDSVTSAAPIMDQNNQIVAAVGLRQYLPLEEQRYDNEELQYSLKMISALASIFEVQLKKQTNNINICNYDFLLNMAFNIMDQGILTIGSRGEILYGNKHSYRFLGIDQEDLREYNIGQFMPEDSTLLKALAQGHDINMEECFLINNKTQKHKVTIHPILLNGNLDRYVIKFIAPAKPCVSIRECEECSAHYKFDSIVGDSKAMCLVKDKALCYAGSQENILIIGESGTGKELIAQAIHNERRPEGPFIPINCSALPRDLAISELFGYESGSFSGADRRGRIGKIELARGGTLFLDEIGDMPSELQPVLLRVLEDKQIMRVGGHNYKKVDFQLICATNKNLNQLSATNEFRKDLFYRISTLIINIPSLRERKDDLELLCRYFLRKHSDKNYAVTHISRPAMDAIIGYDWPGNIRQLENTIIGALISARYNTIELHDLPTYITDNAAISIPIDNGSTMNEDKSLFDLRSYRRLDQDVISKIMKKYNGNVAQASDYLGVSRSTLYRRLKTFK